MRRTIIALAAACCTLALVALVVARSDSARAAQPDPLSKLTPEARAQLAALPPGDVMTVIVTLTKRANLAPVATARIDRRARVAETVRALRATSDTEQAGLRAQLQARRAQGKVRDFRAFWIFNGLAVTADADTIREVAARPEVATIDVNRVIQAPEPALVAPAADPEPNISLINAPALWDLGFTGEGVVVASLDTGVDLANADIAAAYRGGDASWFDPYGQHPTPADSNGHGTETMSAIVGGASGGTAIGVAPGAKWISAKIFNDAGAATSEGIHAAFEWLLAPGGSPANAPDVVNNSWTFRDPGCFPDFEPDLAALRTAGILPVFAGGNYGPDLASSRSPGNNPSAFPVGSITNDGFIASTSSRGPNLCATPPLIYPSVVAPGVNVRVATCAGGYTIASGTSFAAPHVAGAAALLLDAYPTLTPAQLQAALVNTAVDSGPHDPDGPDHAFGYGRIDVLAAFLSLADVPDPEIVPSSSSLATSGSPSTTATAGADLVVAGRVVEAPATPGSAAEPASVTVCDPIGVPGISAVNLGAEVAVFGRNDAGQLWYRETASGVFGAWTLLGADAASRPEAAALGPDPYVFFRGATGDLRYYHRTGGAWSASESLGGTIVGSPAAAFDGSGRLVVAVLNGAGEIWYRFLEGGAWSPWARMDGQLAGPLALVNYQGDVYLFGLNSAGTSWTRTWGFIGFGWGPWTNLGGVLAGGHAAGNHLTSLFVFGLNPAGIPWYRELASGAWGPWTMFDGQLDGSPAAISTANRLIFGGTNANGDPWTRAASGSWGPWEGLGGKLATSPEGVALGAEGYFFGLNSAGTLWYRTWDGTSWDAWTSLGGVLAIE
jgi:subtilisin family serine protease